MTRNTRVVTCCLLTWIGLGCSSPGNTTTDNAGTAGSAGQAAASVPVTTQPAGSPATQPPVAAASGNAASVPASASVAQPTAAAQAPAAASGSQAPASNSGANTAAMPGSAAAPSDAASAQPTGAAGAATPGVVDFTKDPRGSCPDLHTNFPDDHACIAAPPPELGFQIHVGPSNYDDPAEIAKFVIKPGEEKTECYTLRTTNEQELVYQTNALSGRAGTHHIINTLWSGDMPTGTFVEGCGSGIDPFDANAPTQIGSIPGASKAYMERRSVAPEFADVGRKLPAKSLVTSDMHYYNFTDKDILREYWVNLYYAPKEQEIKRMSQDIAAFGGLGWNANPIAPGTDMVYKYECPITGNGWIINLLGHYHLHGKRFGVSIKHKSTGMSEKVFEMYDPQDPAVFDYNSVAMNPAFSDLSPGATSGMLPVSDGDILQWECHIINDSDVALKYTNEVKTGEMCNTWGFTVGTMPLKCGQP
jgi:hypothetical protein